MSIANQFKHAKAPIKNPKSKVEDRRGILAIDAFEDIKPAPTLPIPKQKRGRPPTGFDPKEYHKLYQRDKRSADKLGISVKEYRSRKSNG